MNQKYYIDGKHYTEYNEEIKRLKKLNDFIKLEELLLKIINTVENESIETGFGVAPGYYNELISLYKKVKDKDKLQIVFERFFKQPKARGKGPLEIYKSYLKFKGLEEPSRDLTLYIYNLYKTNLIEKNYKVIEKKCPCCNKVSIFSVPKDENVELIGTCCPICFNSIVL